MRSEVQILSPRPDLTRRRAPLRPGAVDTPASHLGPTEPVRAVPVPDGFVCVGSHDDIEMELGQAAGPGVEDAGRVALAGPGAGAIRPAVRDLDAELHHVAAAVLAQVVDVGAGRDPFEVGVLDGADVAEWLGEVFGARLVEVERVVRAGRRDGRESHERNERRQGREGSMDRWHGRLSPVADRGSPKTPRAWPREAERSAPDGSTASPR